MKPPHIATITHQTPVGGNLDSALANLEDQKNLCPKKFLIPPSTGMRQKINKKLKIEQLKIQMNSVISTTNCKL
jgi:hypothetical protein